MSNDISKKQRQHPVQAVFWDIDGTLIDSEELHYQVIADWCIMRGYHLKKIDNEILLGKSMAEKWQHLSTVHDFAADATTFFSECAAMYCQRLTSDLEREETTAIFRSISERNIPQACVSNGDMIVVCANLHILRLSDLVSFSISGEDVTNGKPAPEPYLLAAQRLGIEPKHCLAIEDSKVGVQAAATAGMTVIAWPEHGMAKDGYELAHYFLQSSEEFPWHLFSPQS